MDQDKENGSEFVDRIDELTEKLDELSLKYNGLEKGCTNMMAHLPCVVMRFDKDLRFIYANSAMQTVFGIPPENAVGANHHAAGFSESLSQNIEAAIRSVFNSKSECRIEFSVSTPQGRKTCISSMFPDFDDRGEVISVLVVTTDITHVRLVEKQLHDAMKMEAVGRLAGGIANDFNNLLSVILGYADILAEQINDEKLKKHCECIITAAGRASDLTRQLLTYGRKSVFRAVPVDIHRIIRDNVRLTQSGSTRKIDVQLELNADRSIVDIDKSVIQSVVMQLILIAVDSIRNARHLFIETSNTTIGSEEAPLFSIDMTGRDFVRIKVSNSNGGDAGQGRDALLEPVAGNGHDFLNTGVGLSAIYGAVASFGGAITSCGDTDLGTTCTIYLPVSTSEEYSDEILNGVELPSKCVGRILVVDDEEMVLDLAQELLEMLGYEVFTCNGGREAVDFFSDNLGNIDLVLLDMVMPEMSGSEVFDELKLLDPEVKVIISSGYLLEFGVKELLDNGIRDFVPKPYHLHTLAEKVVRQLST